MALENAKEHLKKYNLEKNIMIVNESSATVDDAAHAIGCEPAKIAKTLSFLLDEIPILIVMAGDTKVDNTKYKNHFNKKAKMIPKEDLNNLIGHVAGGVCPFGIKENVKVYLDTSLRRFEKVYPACGSTNSVIELTIKELETCSQYVEWVDITKSEC